MADYVTSNFYLVATEARGVLDPKPALAPAGGGSPAPSAQYTNRVWDTVAGRHVRWVTAAPDPAGASYPGPGVYGVDTSDYCVESIST
jgi:hypothetical protein